MRVNDRNWASAIGSVDGTITSLDGFDEGELTVSAQTQDVGEARESLPVSYAGEALEIGFNAEFLRDGIESITDETVRMKLISPLRPGLLHGESDDFLYLIMPIRLAG